MFSNFPLILCNPARKTGGNLSEVEGSPPRPLNRDSTELLKQETLAVSLILVISHAGF